MTTEPPRWFRHALANRPEHRETTLDDCRIHLRCWGDRDLPGLVLVHGGLANSGWWDHIAPFLAEHHRVVALDLSGHGDSEWRPAYDMKVWAREVLAAADAGGIEDTFRLVGHSMGGWVSASVAALHGDRISDLVLIDTPLRDAPPEGEQKPRRSTRVYPTREEIVPRFTTVPAQDLILPYISRHVAEESIHPVEGGWTWKFDPGGFHQRIPLRDLLPEIACPVAYLRAEFGMVSPGMAAEISALLEHRAAIVDLPDAGHHPMLDQPLPLVAALRTTLAHWSVR